MIGDQRIIKMFRVQKCIGYAGRRTWMESEVDFTDGTSGTIYTSTTADGRGNVQMDYGYQTTPPTLDIRL